MKHNAIQILACSCLLLLMACKKEVDCEKPPGLKGEWIWVKSVGGFGGWTETPETNKATKTLKIDDALFREYRNDSLVFQSKYTLGVSDKTLVGTEDRNYIAFESGDVKAIIVGESELELIDQCYDCFSHKYRRK